MPNALPALHPSFYRRRKCYERPVSPGGIGSPELYSRIFSGFNLRPYLEARNDLNLRAQYGIAPEDIVIGKIARLFYLKGHDDLFAVAPKLIESEPRLKFLLVGDGFCARI
jgi:glycosyltransferase involved in cell wall biosynthesis